MDSVLIVGVDGVVGANCAAVLSEFHAVSGTARTPLRSVMYPVDVVGFPTLEAAAAILRQRAPSRVIHCGAGAESCWGNKVPTTDEVESVRIWLQAATATSAAFTLISSDAVFTGPWMFHSEHSQSLCKSAEAQRLKQLEDHVLAHRPDALVIRTHAFGWGPIAESNHTPNWMESVLESLQAAATPRLDYVRHASPILASDLAHVIEGAWSAGLAGIYHVAGAERVNPVQMAQRLAHQFGLGFALSQYRESLTDPAQGFGRGETSLQTRKIRRALGMSLPLLSDGLQRLHEQSLNGYRARLQGTAKTARVA